LSPDRDAGDRPSNERRFNEGCGSGPAPGKRDENIRPSKCAATSKRSMVLAIGDKGVLSAALGFEV
jgi:hypothetical protein